jgi:hypothetical protein
VGKFDYRQDENSDEDQHKDGYSSDIDENKIAALTMQCGAEAIHERYGRGFASIMLIIIDALKETRNAYKALIEHEIDIFPVRDFDIDSLIELTGQEVVTKKDRMQARQWMFDKISEISSFIELSIVDIEHGTMQTEVLFEPIITGAIRKDSNGSDDFAEWNIQTVRIIGGKIPVLEGAAEVAEMVMEEVREFAVKYEGFKGYVTDSSEANNRANINTPVLSSEDPTAIKDEIASLVRFTIDT